MAETKQATDSVEAAAPVALPQAQEQHDQLADGEVLYCVNHPNKETLLRCNRCGKPICLDCAKLTDVGYRCNECIRGVQANYFNAESMDNPIALGVATVVTMAATPVVGLLLRMFGFFFGIILAVMIGSAAGGILAQIIRKAINRRRGRYLALFTMIGVGLGLFLGSFLTLILIGALPLNIPTLVFAVLAASTAYGVLRV